MEYWYDVEYVQEIDNVSNCRLIALLCSLSKMYPYTEEENLHALLKNNLRQQNMDW
jgi:hypothetical protein